MVLLSVAGIRKHYGPDPVLADVTIDIRAGDKIGLVGPNGTGKSTLMKILAGCEEADSGRMDLSNSAKVGYLEQQPKFTGDTSVWEEASTALADVRKLAEQVEQLAHSIAVATTDQERKRLGDRLEQTQYQLQIHDGYQLDLRIERILSGLGFSRATYEQPVSLLSGGQQNRLMLAKLLLAEPDLMLLDEPSNHLDIDATEWLENFLRNSPQAVLMVSHDRYLLDRVTTVTAELFRGTIDSYAGNFSAYVRQKAERLEVQRRTYERQQIEIAKMEDFIRRNHFGQKATQAEDRRKKLERLERVDPPREISAPAMTFPPASRTGDIVVRVEHLSKGFDRPLIQDLSFDVLRGEKWGIVGPNGCGKSTLIHCLLGTLKLDAGRVILGAGVKIAFFDQKLESVDDDMQVLDAVRPTHKEFIDQQRRDLLAKFGVTGEMVFQKVGSLSGGERNRVALARLSAMDANVLILDEPTNHLDLWARDALERALCDYSGTVLFVSHDRYFVNRVADHLLIVEPGRFRVIEGNYDTYIHLLREGLVRDHRGGVGVSLRNEPPARAAAESRPSLPDDNATDKQGKRKRRFPYRKAADVEAEIHAVENRVTELHALLGTESVLRDGQQVKTLMAELDAAQERLPHLYEHWDEAVQMNG